MAAIACWLTASGPLRAEEFFATRDQNPLLRGFYLPLPSDSRPDSGKVLSATVLISNTLNVEHTSHESLFVDGESDALDLTYENALTQRWRYRFSVPIVHDSSGFLDSAIDTWHELFGFHRGSRPFYPKSRFGYEYSGNGKISLNHPQTNLGDLAADVGWYAADDARRTVSLWGGLKAPTGSVSDLTSDGAWDGALWAHTAIRWPKWQLAAELGVAQPFGDEIFAGRRTAPQVSRVLRPLVHSSGVVAARSTRRPNRPRRRQRYSLSRPSLQLTVGAVRRLRGRWRMQMGLTEDAAVNTAPISRSFLGFMTKQCKIAMSSMSFSRRSADVQDED